MMVFCRFLGNFQPQSGKPEVWEMDLNQQYEAGRNGQSNIDGNGRTHFKRSLSDGSILHENGIPISSSNIKEDLSNADSSNAPERGSKILSESAPDMPTCESDLTYSRPSIPTRELFIDMPRDRFLEQENEDAYDCSNFFDLDWLSSSGNSCEEDILERSMLISPIAGVSSENVVDDFARETTPSVSGCGSSMKGRDQTGTDLSFDDSYICEVREEFSDSFVRWVTNGETLCH